MEYQNKSTHTQYGKFRKGKTRYFETKYYAWTLTFLFLLFFFIREDEWSDDESDLDFDNMHEHDEYSHSEIINRCSFGSKHIINARLSSQTSLQDQVESSTHDSTNQCFYSKEFAGHHEQDDMIKTFPTMLKLISGTLVGGVKYSDLYIDSDENEEKTSANSLVSKKDHGKRPKEHRIPTLHQIAQKIAKLEKTQLDEKQYIAYEMIACTFLLGLLNDGTDKNTKLGAYMQQTMDIATTSGIIEVTKKLKARGGQDQLLMFLTGPAGSGKSTAMKIAQQFCYEFCIAVGIMWGDKTFLFTAYTGSASSLFGGVTISKAAFLNQRKQLSVDDINEWKDVRIVIIDEVSFMSDSILMTLDRKLKDIRNRSLPFGGFSIVFAGDFRQLEAIGAKDTELLFSSLSSQHWDNCINAVIILDNEHRFKEDPEYGQMLKRMWSGDLTKDDRMRINSRVLGTSGLEVPHNFAGK